MDISRCDGIFSNGPSRSIVFCPHHHLQRFPDSFWMHACSATQSYDCSACEEGGAFSTVEAISCSKGDYDLLSTSNYGDIPTSVFADDDDAGDSEFGFGEGLRSILRTKSSVAVAVVVATIVAITALCGLCIFWHYDNKLSRNGFSTGDTKISLDTHVTNNNTPHRMN